MRGRTVIHRFWHEWSTYPQVAGEPDAATTDVGAVRMTLLREANVACRGHIEIPAWPEWVS